MDSDRILKDLARIAEQVERSFKEERRLLSFREYLALFATDPVRHSRDAARYVRDMFDFFGRVPVERRASASLGAHIGHREARGAFLHVRLECRILSDAHAYHIDDVALVARNALVKERYVQRPNVFHACDALALHRLLRDSRDGLPSDAWINNWHGLLPYGR